LVFSITIPHLNFNIINSIYWEFCLFPSTDSSEISRLFLWDVCQTIDPYLLYYQQCHPSHRCLDLLLITPGPLLKTNVLNQTSSFIEIQKTSIFYDSDWDMEILQKSFPAKIIDDSILSSYPYSEPWNFVSLGFNLHLQLIFYSSLYCSCDP
jgi:hypothetical protein